MTNNTYKAFALATLAILVLSCNKNSTSWFNRNYQNTIARYNVYYNGTEKLKEGVQTLALNHKDDYDKVLDVFPYGDEQQAKAQQGAMDEIIKKGSKIIIDRPVSKWVDDAYLLVGKAYFFKADYFAAIETFQYINSRYKNTEIAQEATIWILKSYMMLKRYDDAEALVGLLKDETNFPPHLNSLLAATAAQVYIKQGKYEPALKNIRSTLAKTRKRDARARYNFITAQLFERLGQPDSAKFYLEKVLKLNPPYDLAFNAKISLARNYDPNDNGQVRTARRYLRSMLRDDKNISYYDQIYYQLGKIEQHQNNRNNAIEYYLLSLQTAQNNQNQKAVTYLALADLYFEIPDYTLAQQYYDSTVRVIQPEFSEYKTIVKKQSVLSELIKYKVIVAREDSLQKLALLSPSELERKVDRWIKEEENRKKRAEQEKENEQNQPPAEGGGFPGLGTPGNPNLGQQTAGTGSNWYFYSQQQMGIGYSDFQRNWGNRKLTDDWRWSGKEKTQNNIADPNNTNDPEENENDSAQAQTTADPELEKRLSDIPEAKRKYYRDIPFAEEDKIRSNNKIAGALYNIGLIYFEKLSDMPEAIAAFESLLTRFAGSEYEPRAYYYLYKIYKTSQPEKSDTYKELLISKYPDTDYARLVNDQSITKKTNDGIEQRKLDYYNSTFDLYKNNKFKDVKSRKPVADTMFAGTSLLPKYLLIYAVSVGKTDSIGAYKRSLEYILEQYPATDISQRAQELLDATARLEKKDTTNSSGGGRDVREDEYKFTPDDLHFVIMVFPKEKGDVNSIRVKLSDYNQSSFPNQTFEVIPSVINNTQQLIIIRNFEGKDKANDYKKQLESFHALLMGNLQRNEVYYSLLTPSNYATLLKQQDIEPYKSFYNRYYR